MRNLIESINNIRSTRLLSIDEDQFGKIRLQDGPSTRTNGLYWIYTDYSNNEILNCRCSNMKGALNLPQLVSQHSELNFVCNIVDQGYRIVYNGIGGTGVEGSGGLRERLVRRNKRW